MYVEEKSCAEGCTMWTSTVRKLQRGGGTEAKGPSCHVAPDPGLLPFRVLQCARLSTIVFAAEGQQQRRRPEASFDVSRATDSEPRPDEAVRLDEGLPAHTLSYTTSSPVNPPSNSINQQWQRSRHTSSPTSPRRTSPSSSMSSSRSSSSSASQRSLVVLRAS